MSRIEGGAGHGRYCHATFILDDRFSGDRFVND